MLHAATCFCLHQLYIGGGDESHWKIIGSFLCGHGLPVMCDPISHLGRACINKTVLQQELGAHEGKQYGKGSQARLWPAAHAAFKDNMKMPSGVKPWTGQAEFHGVSRNPRILDILDSGLVYKLQETGKAVREITQGYWANLWQSLQRKPWYNNLPVATCNSVLYSYEKDCVLPGHSHLRLMGYPDDMAPARLLSESALPQCD